MVNFPLFQNSTTFKTREIMYTVRKKVPDLSGMYFLKLNGKKSLLKELTRHEA
jgi:hypothetical protein